ncbi:FAD-dependent monooxygenase [Sinorhizobium numidicum]|uniref:FAD-dependent monooxygenase n=1 Tax=Sinorhizobium numidicum TaxID=680248 RepID=A0ABY8CU76_9HYPH|nr:FAD-dependent oxidoreductase [Sinorhizobium numidicum]WEX78804.1 FAD-dependent monooxygenase [Sinorhizobium numidicum]WEX82201.1 FAD-dependent monooxygenase [Sinorhizobium numidicum]
MQSADPVAIVGAGIAGLTAALCLARRGFKTDIFEQAEALEETGAGLQLSPNASRILIELGLLPALQDVWSEPDSIALVDGRSLRLLARVPAGSSARNRWAAPYGVLHRGSLQRVLLKAVEAEPLCRLHLGRRIEGDPEAAITNGIGCRASMIIGADGIWSRVRASIAGAGSACFSGNVAWRLMLPRHSANAHLSADRVTAFLGPNAHLVAYPIRETDSFNLVAIIEGKPTDGTWAGRNSEDRQREFTAAFESWHPDLHALLDDAASATYWPLYTVGDGAWHNGRDIVLIGDAAHAMTPFAAQGAAMAIEDACELARYLACSADVPSALAQYDSARRPRIARVRQRAAFNRFAYHARGPVRIGRDLVLALKGPEALAADLDWLYGYGAPER